MNYADIKTEDIANGPGIRVSLFVSGCRNACDGCFNKEAWDFSYGHAYTNDTVVEILDALKRPYISGLSILGGDPFEPENFNGVWVLCADVKAWVPNRTIWLYTGYRFEDFMDHPIMKLIDVVVDGKFEKDKRDITLAFRGSSNQRVIDVKRSLYQKEIVLYEIDH